MAVASFFFGKLHKSGLGIFYRTSAFQAYCKISDDVKRAAIRLFEHNLLKNILDCCKVSEWTWYQNHPTGIPGRICHLVGKDILVQLIRDNPDYFLDEIVKLMKNNHYISVHFSTIFNKLERAGISRKKLK